MESRLSKATEEARRQEEILKQIAQLKSQLNDSSSTTALPTPSSPKRKRQESSVQLVPATPSPKKKRKIERTSEPTQKITPLSYTKPAPRPRCASQTKRQSPAVSAPTAPSSVLTKLASLADKGPEDSQREHVERSSAFSDAPPKREEVVDKRDDRLALIEDIEPGPADHKPSFDDPYFEKLEPNSGIRLSSRTLPHEDLQEYLFGRYYLSPSRLYSCIRLLPGKGCYDVPVPGDFITIAVVAERGPIKWTKAPVGANIDSTGPPEGRQSRYKEKIEAEKKPFKPTGKKYVNFKLVDFGTREKSSGTGGKAVIRGDALLTLLLFEADSCDKVVNPDGREEKVYKGGSKGAFETLSKIKEGDVIALLNPRILKPFQSTNDKPHPTNNVLAVTPESAASITVIGRSEDLGRCSVVKKDGKRCESWCDKRVTGDVCEWHVQQAVERRRAGRAEFSVGTSGMSTTSKPKRKTEYDPSRQYGLKPELDSGIGSTYVISGHVISSGSNRNSDLFAAENMGREGQAKAARKANDKDKELIETLSKRDKEGMRSVLLARAAGKNPEKEGAGKKKGKNHALDVDVEGDEETEEQSSCAKRGYSANVIKHLGFDPAGKLRKSSESNDIQKKINDLASLSSARKNQLGPRPGPKIRSGVVAPKTSCSVGRLSTSSNKGGCGSEEDGMVDLDSED